VTVIRIDNLAGVPILFDRDPISNHGRTGYAIRPKIDAAFGAEADRAFSEVFISLSASDIGEVQSILTGGISRSGSSASYHHKKRAFDLDGLVFTSGYVWVANTLPTRRFEYLLIEGHLRPVFGTVLTYGFDDQQRDHIHFDNGESVGFRPHSKSRTLFLQNVLRYLFDENVEVDGVYGPETRRAERVVRDELQIGHLSKTFNWLEFLTASIEAAEERLSSAAILKAFG